MMFGAIGFDDIEQYVPSSLKTVIITGGKTIPELAFCGCTSLTSITIPNSVTEIGEWAFYSCTSFASIVIPDRVTSIGNWAFSYCTSLTNITYQGTMEQWDAITKDSGWNSGTGNYTIHCTDGDITK